MNKSDLIKKVSEDLNIPHQQSEKAVNAFFSTIASSLTAAQRIELRGFGSFDVKTYDGYMGRNPKTGEDVPVPPKVLPRFKAGKEVRNILNK